MEWRTQETLRRTWRRREAQLLRLLTASNLTSTRLLFEDEARRKRAIRRGGVVNDADPLDEDDLEISASDFVRLMMKLLGSFADKNELCIQVLELFAAIDVNGDKTMQFSELLNYVVESGTAGTSASAPIGASTASSEAVSSHFAARFAYRAVMSPTGALGVGGGTLESAIAAHIAETAAAASGGGEVGRAGVEGPPGRNSRFDTLTHATRIRPTVSGGGSGDELLLGFKRGCATVHVFKWATSVQMPVLHALRRYRHEEALASHGVLAALYIPDTHAVVSACAVTEHGPWMLQFWDFDAQLPLARVPLGAPASLLLYCSALQRLIVFLDDGSSILSVDVHRMDVVLTRACTDAAITAAVKISGHLATAALIGTADGAIDLMDLRTLHRIPGHRVLAHDYGVRVLAISDDHKVLLSAGAPHPRRMAGLDIYAVLLWDVSSVVDGVREGAGYAASCVEQARHHELAQAAAALAAGATGKVASARRGSTIGSAPGSPVAILSSQQTVSSATGAYTRWRVRPTLLGGHRAPTCAIAVQDELGVEPHAMTVDESGVMLVWHLLSGAQLQRAALYPPPRMADVQQASRTSRVMEAVHRGASTAAGAPEGRLHKRGTPRPSTAAMRRNVATALHGSSEIVDASQGAARPASIGSGMGPGAAAGGNGRPRTATGRPASRSEALGQSTSSPRTGTRGSSTAISAAAAPIEFPHGEPYRLMHAGSRLTYGRASVSLYPHKGEGEAERIARRMLDPALLPPPVSAGPGTRPGTLARAGSENHGRGLETLAEGVLKNAARYGIGELVPAAGPLTSSDLAAADEERAYRESGGMSGDAGGLAEELSAAEGGPTLARAGGTARGRRSRSSGPANLIEMRMGRRGSISEYAVAIARHAREESEVNMDTVLRASSRSRPHSADSARSGSGCSGGSGSGCDSADLPRHPSSAVGSAELPSDTVASAAVIASEAFSAASSGGASADSDVAAPSTWEPGFVTAIVPLPASLGGHEKRNTLLIAGERTGIDAGNDPGGLVGRHGMRLFAWLQDLPDHEPLLHASFVSPTLTFLTASSQAIVIWDALTGRPTRVYDSRICDGHEITSVTLDERGRKIFVGDATGNVRVINLLSGAVMKELDPRASRNPPGGGKGVLPMRDFDLDRTIGSSSALVSAARASGASPGVAGVPILALLYCGNSLAVYSVDGRGAVWLLDDAPIDGYGGVGSASSTLMRILPLPLEIPRLHAGAVAGMLEDSRPQAGQVTRNGSDDPPITVWSAQSQAQHQQPEPPAAVSAVPAVAPAALSDPTDHLICVTAVTVSTRLDLIAVCSRLIRDVVPSVVSDSGTPGTGPGGTPASARPPSPGYTRQRPVSPGTRSLNASLAALPSQHTYAVLLFEHERNALVGACAAYSARKDEGVRQESAAAATADGAADASASRASRGSREERAADGGPASASRPQRRRSIGSVGSNDGDPFSVEMDPVIAAKLGLGGISGLTSTGAAAGASSNIGGAGGAGRLNTSVIADLLLPAATCMQFLDPLAALLTAHEDGSVRLWAVPPSSMPCTCRAMWFLPASPTLLPSSIAREARSMRQRAGAGAGMSMTAHAKRMQRAHAQTKDESGGLHASADGTAARRPSPSGKRRESQPPHVHAGRSEDALAPLKRRFVTSICARPAGSSPPMRLGSLFPTGHAGFVAHSIGAPPAPPYSQQVFLIESDAPGSNDHDGEGTGSSSVLWDHGPRPAMTVMAAPPSQPAISRQWHVDYGSTVGVGTAEGAALPTTGSGGDPTLVIKRASDSVDEDGAIVWAGDTDGEVHRWYLSPAMLASAGLAAAPVEEPAPNAGPKVLERYLDEAPLLHQAVAVALAWSRSQSRQWLASRTRAVAGSPDMARMAQLPAWPAVPEAVPPAYTPGSLAQVQARGQPGTASPSTCLVRRDMPACVVWEGSWRAHSGGDITSLSVVHDSGVHCLLTAGVDGLARLWDSEARLCGTLDPTPRFTAPVPEFTADSVGEGVGGSSVAVAALGNFIAAAGLAKTAGTSGSEGAAGASSSAGRAAPTKAGASASAANAAAHGRGAAPAATAPSAVASASPDAVRGLQSPLQLRKAQEAARQVEASIPVAYGPGRGSGYPFDLHSLVHLCTERVVDAATVYVPLSVLRGTRSVGGAWVHGYAIDVCAGLEWQAGSSADESPVASESSSSSGTQPPPSAGEPPSCSSDSGGSAASRVSLKQAVMMATGLGVKRSGVVSSMATNRPPTLSGLPDGLEEIRRLQLDPERESGLLELLPLSWRTPACAPPAESSGAVPGPLDPLPLVVRHRTPVIVPVRITIVDRSRGQRQGVLGTIADSEPSVKVGGNATDMSSLVAMAVQARLAAGVHFSSTAPPQRQVLWHVSWDLVARREKQKVAAEQVLALTSLMRLKRLPGWGRRLSLLDTGLRRLGESMADDSLPRPLPGGYVAAASAPMATDSLGPSGGVGDAAESCGQRAVADYLAAHAGAWGAMAQAQAAASGTAGLPSSRQSGGQHAPPSPVASPGAVDPMSALAALAAPGAATLRRAPAAEQPARPASRLKASRPATAPSQALQRTPYIVRLMEQHAASTAVDQRMAPSSPKVEPIQSPSGNHVRAVTPTAFAPDVSKAEASADSAAVTAAVVATPTAPAAVAATATTTARRPAGPGAAVTDAGSPPDRIAAGVARPSTSSLGMRPRRALGGRRATAVDGIIQLGTPVVLSAAAQPSMPLSSAVLADEPAAALCAAKKPSFFRADASPPLASLVVSRPETPVKTGTSAGQQKGAAAADPGGTYRIRVGTELRSVTVTDAVAKTLAHLSEAEGHDRSSAAAAGAGRASGPVTAALGPLLSHGRGGAAAEGDAYGPPPGSAEALRRNVALSAKLFAIERARKHEEAAERNAQRRAARQSMRKS